MTDTTFDTKKFQQDNPGASLGDILGAALTHSKHHEREKNNLSRYNAAREHLLENGFEKFVTLSEEMYQEFKQLDGCVTCEHSTTDDHLGFKMAFLAHMSMIDPNSIGYWTVNWCDTCFGYHPGHPFHCEIIRIKP